MLQFPNRTRKERAGVAIRGPSSAILDWDLRHQIAYCYKEYLMQNIFSYIFQWQCNLRLTKIEVVVWEVGRLPGVARAHTPAESLIGFWKSRRARLPTRLFRSTPTFNPPVSQLPPHTTHHNGAHCRQAPAQIPGCPHIPCGAIRPPALAGTTDSSASVNSC